MFRRIGIVSRVDLNEALKLANDIANYLSRRKVEVILEEELAKALKLNLGKVIAEMDADLILTIGGDGTILKTCMHIPRSETPILSIDMGRRGYLTEVPPERAFKAIDDCLAGRYNLEEHSKLSVFHEGKFLIDGLNEALIISKVPFKTLNFDVTVGDSKLVELRADGLIIATPTGSTAHAFSAGGPILETSLNALDLVFICPLKAIRSIVVSDRLEVKVKVLDGEFGAMIVVDGCYRREIPPSSTISMRKSERKAVFVRFETKFLSKRLSRLISRV